MNKKTATLEDAIAIAAQAHLGQKDKAGACYILHPLRLMMKMKTESEMMAAILHDVVEDTRKNPEENKWTFERLREQGFSEEVLEALKCLTNEEGEGYEQFIKRAGTNPIARRVKIADLEDNMDVKRLETFTDRDAERIAKYLRAWRSLSLKNSNKTRNDSLTTAEREALLKENPFPSLTPEQAAISKEMGDKAEGAILKSLDEDNKEIFGEDYIKK